MKLLLLPFLLLFSATPALAAQQDYGIVATVNDQIITNFDVEKRMKLVLVTTDIEDTKENRERLRPQVIRSLVDERLQLQEAYKNDITVGPDEVTKGIAMLEQQRGMPAGSLEPFLVSKGVDTSSFQQQLKAQIAWNNLVVRKVRSNVKVSEEEIELARGRMQDNPANQEVKIAVLTLPVDKPEHDAEVRRTAQKLAAEIRKKASFEQVAQQFAAAKADGGAVVSAIWINPLQLDPAIARALVKTEPNAITNPVRTEVGYTIAKLLGRRAAEKETSDDQEVVFKDILIHLKDNASAAESSALQQIAELIAKHPGECREAGLADIGDVSAFDIETQVRTEKISNMPASMRGIAKSLPVGQVSTPVDSEEGMRLFMMCEKKPIPASEAEKEHIYNMLMQQKMQLEAQKFLRDLRRTAYIDIR